MNVYIETRGDIVALNTDLDCDVRLYGHVEVEQLYVDGVSFADILSRLEYLERRMFDDGK